VLAAEGSGLVDYRIKLCDHGEKFYFCARGNDARKSKKFLLSFVRAMGEGSGKY